MESANSDSSFHSGPHPGTQFPPTSVRSEKDDIQVCVYLMLSETMRASSECMQPAPQSCKAQELTPNTKETSPSRAKPSVSLTGSTQNQQCTGQILNNQ